MIIAADGTKIWMGGHLASKVGAEEKRYEGPYGTLTVNRKNLDATQVPKAMITAYGVLGLSADRLATTQTTEGTTRALAREQTSRAGINATKNVQLKALASPLPEGLTPQAIPR